MGRRMSTKKRIHSETVVGGGEDRFIFVVRAAGFLRPIALNKWGVVPARKQE